MGRFINADASEILLEEQGNLLQYNLYTYCWNNPVNMLDTTGESPANIIGAIAGGVAGASLGILLAKELRLTGAKKKALIAAATVGGAALGAFLGPYAAKLGKKVISAVKTAGKKVACKVTKKACFVAGILVLTEDGNIPIEEVEEGDYVYAENPETGEKGLKRVARTFINESEELIHVYVNQEEIVATPQHPFYVIEKGWIGAVDLRAGDILVLQNGEYVIVELVQYEILEAPISVYNFEVEDFHTYYVGESSVLVHNMCDRITNVSKAESKIWKKLQSAKNGLKKSGSGKNLRYYSWDNLHNEIEVFDRFGKHLGVMDPTTGQIIKSAVRGRSIKI